MLLATLDAETKQEIVETVGEVMSGTPDAARAEPFTWVMGLLIICCVIAVLIIVCTFCWRLFVMLMDFIAGQSAAQKAMADECHKTARENTQVATAAAAKCESALDRHADVMERVILKLGTP